MRITAKSLDEQAAYLNRLTGNPEKPYTKTPDGLKANVGCFYISKAYGGYNLVQMTSESGGVRDVVSAGHIKPKDLSLLISAFTQGIAEGTRI